MELYLQLPKRLHEVLKNKFTLPLLVEISDDVATLPRAFLIATNVSECDAN